MRRTTTMERKQFTFYASFAAAISRIRGASARCAAYDAIVNYAIYGVEPDVDSLPDAAAIAFDLIRPTLDTAARRSVGGTIRAVGQHDSSAAAQPQLTDSSPAAQPQLTGSSASAQPQLTGSSASAQPQLSGSEKEKEREGEKEKEKENENENENECSTPSGPSFDAFWAAYPRKAGREAARKAFAQVKVPTETLIAAIEAQKRTAQWVRDGGRYIPYPATWLREGRWEDEPAPPGQGGGDPPVDLEAMRRLLARVRGEAPPGADAGGGKEGG